MSWFKKRPPAHDGRGTETQQLLQEILNGVNKMAAVQIDQTDLDNFASAVETGVTAIKAAADTVTNAASTVGAYIQQLVTGQAEPLPEADKTAITQALADLAGASEAVSTATSGLTALEPPAPAPAS